MGYPRVYANVDGDGVFVFTAEAERVKCRYSSPSSDGNLDWTENEIKDIKLRLVYENDADSDHPHHAPSPTIGITPQQEEVFAIRNTGFGACEATVRQDRSTMNVAIPVGDEPLTKRERMAMEFYPHILLNYQKITDDVYFIGCDCRSISGMAVSCADQLIAALAKEMKE